MHRILPTLPILGIIAAIILYFCAASGYSAATTLDPAAAGYRHLHDYWCTLFATVTYTGERNLGRPFALAATMAVVVAIFFFWLAVTRLFADYRILCAAIRTAGSLSILAGALIFTPLHDRVITLAAPLGFGAIIATCIGLALKREYRLLVLALLAILACVTDYLAWMLHLWMDHQPLIQKLAFALLFLWILAAAAKIWTFPEADAGRGETEAPRPSAVCT